MATRLQSLACIFPRSFSDWSGELSLSFGAISSSDITCAGGNSELVMAVSGVTGVSLQQLPQFHSPGLASCRGCSSRNRRLTVKAISTQPSSLSARPQNVPGEIYVDHTCIDCDTCRWMAPSVFARVDEQSAVYSQPTSAEERVAALQALLACPTASIHTQKPQADIKKIHATFPLAVDEENAPGVYHCGFHSEKSFGAASYFVVRPEGNILVDSPRFTETLAKKLESMGGIRYMFLTHKDDVADHKRWHNRFKCKRILHETEVQEHTSDVEMKLQGEGPWNFIGSDVDLILVPGHTTGSVALHYKPKQVLFSGDHLFADSNGELAISHTYNFHSVRKQVDSVKRLIPLDFVWLLPGHGRRIKFESFAEKNAAIESLVAKELAETSSN